MDGRKETRMENAKQSLGSEGDNNLISCTCHIIYFSHSGWQHPKVVKFVDVMKQFIICETAHPQITRMSLHICYLLK